MKDTGTHQDEKVDVRKVPQMAYIVWALREQDGLIRFAGGKVYILRGTDKANFGLLRKLARSDFAAAIWELMPTQFLRGSNEESWPDRAPNLTVLSDPQIDKRLVEHVIVRLEDSRQFPSVTKMGMLHPLLPRVSKRRLVLATVLNASQNGELVLAAIPKFALL